MAYRYRKSIKITKGLKVNLTKTGIGMTVGGRGAHYSIHSSGRQTTTVGIPGTGMSYTSVHKNDTKNKSTKSSQAIRPANDPKPGLFAPMGEKLIYESLKRGIDTDLLKKAELIPHFTLAARLFRALKLATFDDKNKASVILQQLYDANYRPEKDKTIQKYANASQLIVGLAPNINLTLALNYQDLTLFTAELYRQESRFKEASILAHGVSDSFQKSVFISLLCITTERYEPILLVTNGINNDSEQGMLLLIYRGIALGKAGHLEASISTFKEVFRYPSRSINLKMFGWRERGKIYLDNGIISLAKKDFEKVYSQDSEYNEIGELLAKTG